MEFISRTIQNEFHKMTLSRKLLQIKRFPFLAPIFSNLNYSEFEKKIYLIQISH
jgi:hypothetical protein